MSTLSTGGYAVDTTWRLLLNDLGLAAADVLRRAGLPDDLLRHPAARVATPDYYRLWAAVEIELGDQPLAIRLCEKVRTESFSPLLFAALCSPNLLMAVRRIAAYKALVAPMRFEVAEQGVRVAVSYEWTDAPPEPPESLVMMELLFAVQLARIGTRARITPVEVTARALPAEPAPYEEFLGCRLRSGPAHRVVFATADAQRPFLTGNEGLWSIFEPELRTRLAELTGPVPTKQRVRAVLFEAIPSGLSSLDAVASRLAMSPRTLQRQVKEEGTTFQDLLRETREALARHYLERTSLPTSEISFLLGFEEPTSFARAFKAWTGTTPATLRRTPRRQSELVAE